MNQTDIVHIGGQALTVAAEVIGPLLIATLVCGVLVSLFQAVFQIQDQTLSMVPRLLVAGGVVALTGGWMLRLLTEFTTQLFNSIPTLLR